MAKSTHTYEITIVVKETAALSFRRRGLGALYHVITHFKKNFKLLYDLVLIFYQIQKGEHECSDIGMFIF